MWLGTAASVAYFGSLAGALLAVGTGLQQTEKLRDERAAARGQAENDSLRRFNTQFAAVRSDARSQDVSARMGAAAGLLSFLRGDNSAFHEQTYYYVLTHLKLPLVEGDDALKVDGILMRVFERAAHLVLPVLGAADQRLALDFSAARVRGADLSGLELAQARLSATTNP